MSMVEENNELPELSKVTLFTCGKFFRKAIISTVMECRDLIGYQLEIAKRWFERGKDAQDQDIYAKFFFYYAGFNALYFLHSKINKGVSDTEIDNLEGFIKQFPEPEARKILEELQTHVNYFLTRKPIEDMSKRNCFKPNVGKPYYGLECQKTLSSHSKAGGRLVALAKILYTVRNNMFHGSKGAGGDDEMIIQNALPPLRRLLVASLDRVDKLYKGMSSEIPESPGLQQSP